MNNQYYQEELKGRGFIQALYAKSQWFYSPVEERLVWDLSGTTVSGSFIGEIKIRYNQSDAYDTAFLEKKKYDSLKAIADANNLSMFYFNIHSDATMIYNLSKLPVESYTISWEMCPASSVENKGQELKEMIHLPIGEVSKKLTAGYKRLNERAKK